MYGGSDAIRWTRRQVMTSTAAGAAVVVLVAGLAVVLGASVLRLELLLGATSPPANAGGNEVERHDVRRANATYASPRRLS